MRWALTGGACLAILVATAGIAAATPPGLNGSFAFERLTGAGNIHSMTSTGGSVTRLTFDAAQESDAAWSPDGTRIAFTSRRDGGNAEIYLMNADGSNQLRFTVDGSVDQEPAWSPDGSRIAWSSDRDTNFDIFSANLNGTNLRQHTLNGAVPDANPEWSPDGSAIAFQSNRSGSGDIYRLSAAGTETDVRQLTSDPGADGSPTWSPDGSRVAFDGVRGGNVDIYSVSSAAAPEGDLRRHTNNVQTDEDPVWSPDGARIAFQSFRNGANRHIWTVGSSGTETSPLQITSTVVDDFEPAWQTVAPAPITATLSPAASSSGAGDLAVIVDGSGFVRRSQVRWNGSPRSTQFVSATRLTFVAPAADLAAAGTAQVSVATTPVGGGASAPLAFTISPVAAPPPPAPPGLIITRARLTPRWSASRLLSRLALAGTLSRPALLEVRLLRRSGKGKALVTRRFRVAKAGDFTRRLRLTPTLLPGRYLVRVREIGGAPPLATVDRATKLSAPPEGVVARAFISTKIGGRPLSRIVGRPSIIFAHFTFASRPKAGKRLTVHWFAPGSRRAVAIDRKPISQRVIAFIKSRGPLPTGGWRAELRHGATLVATARVRLA